MRLLIARPEPQASQLKELAEQQGWQAELIPLIFIDKGRELTSLMHLNNADLLIAVSQHALIYAERWLVNNACLWPTLAEYLAVGDKTANAWWLQLKKQARSFTKPIVPATENSEGLLSLPVLQKVAGKQIVILRGNGGRELLEQELTLKGAQVSYIECYQRQPIQQNQHKLLQLIDENTESVLIATSSELLSLATQNMSEAQVRALPVLVPSKRVEQFAQKLGFLQCYQSQGATNSAIIAELKKVTRAL